MAFFGKFNRTSLYKAGAPGAFFSLIVDLFFNYVLCSRRLIFSFHEGEKGKHTHDTRVLHCHACLSARVA